MDMPVNNAMVEYQLYNYAEFYPLAVVPTDKNGISQFRNRTGRSSDLGITRMMILIIRKSQLVKLIL